MSNTWKPSEEEDAALSSYSKKIVCITDLVGMCVNGQQTGGYIYGRPGISKTHTVRQYLDSNDIAYEYVPGKITPVGLFQTIEAHPHDIIVLDDVSAIFDDKAAVQLLLAALSAPAAGQTVRMVSYIKSNSKVVIPFTGSIIAISNLTLKNHQAKLLEALRSRITTVHHNPSNAEVAAFLLELAAKGLKGLTPEECLEVARYLIEQVQSKGKDDILSIRLFVDKALNYFIAHKEQSIQMHWKDWVNITVNEELEQLHHDLQPVKPNIRMVKADNKEAVLDIIKSEPKASVQQELAKQQLGISRASFFNYKKELQVAGLLSA